VRDRQAQGREEAPRHGLAVLEAVARRGLERMPGRVPEVQRGAHAGRFEGVRGDDGGLHAKAPEHGLGDGAALARGERSREAGHRAVEPRVEEGRLHDLCEAGAERALRQRLEDGGVDEDEARRVKRAREVLSLWQVDGHLAPERAVAGREKRRRRLDDGHTPQRERGGHPAHVPHRPAAEADHSPVAAQASADELLDEAPEDRPGLCGFAVGDEEGFFA
jgi:hypothetical protein